MRGFDWSCVEAEWSVNFSNATRESRLRFEYANIEAFIEILSQYRSCSLTTDLVTRVLKFIILQKLIKFWMNYEDMVWKIRIGDVWSHDTYVHETNPLIWTLNTKFLFEFLALLILKFEYIGKMVYK